MILGLRTTIYPVNDIALAKEWYCAVLECQPYFDQPFYVGFSIGGFELGLIPDGQSATSGAQPLWGVENIDLELARLVHLGAEVLDPVMDVGERIRVAAVKDPFGNRFGLIENPHFRPENVR